MTERNPGQHDAGPSPQLSTGYPLLQISKALTTAEQHDDPSVRAKAQQKIQKWIAVLNGMVDGTLSVGSRTPVDGVPGWATLEVVTGGFATGQLLAGGPLLDHEVTLSAPLPPTADRDKRRLLNRYFITDEGLANLQALLQSSCYEIAVPEEGALLVVAWLVQQGEVDGARALLSEVGAWFNRLRFYPMPMEHPRQFRAQVFLQDVGSTVKQLTQVQPNPHILAQKEAINIWIPLYDQLVSLFLETVVGDVPDLQRGPEGQWVRSPDGKFPVVGGWPCQYYPQGWHSRTRILLSEYQRQRQRHNRCGRPERQKDSFCQLRGYARQILTAPQRLTGRDVGRIRLILARYVAKRGTPNSSRCRTKRDRQGAQAQAPTFKDMAKVIIQRLTAYPQNSGVDDISPIVQPIDAAEAARWQLDVGLPLPMRLQQKVTRCLRESVDVLVHQRVITSGETLARVLPQMTSEIRAAGISDPQLRALYAAIYRAFRQRRSLLLLNLENQIQIEELPWVAAIDRFRRDDLSSQELAKQTLRDLTQLTLTAFPQTLVPNKLLQEMRALAKTAALDLPLVDEIATDIFMGTFSPKFLKAAKAAGNLLEGTLYARYYGIDYGQIRAIATELPNQRQWFQRSTPANHSFDQLCASRAGVTYGGWDAAINGMIIEQQQILTSQNLAVLLMGLDLSDTLDNQYPDLAQQCFKWVCKRLQIKVDHWHGRLIQLKNAAYAWRQMIFFLSLLSRQQGGDFLFWAEAYLHQQPTAFQHRFRPAVRGLVLAAAGCSLDDEAAQQLGGRRFLGWSKQRHWLL